jgi:nucleoside-diphosphate-sugar epimerase
MKILLLGGTGAMGIPLTNILSADGMNIVYVTTRSPKLSRDNVIYFQGNAREANFYKRFWLEGHLMPFLTSWYIVLRNLKQSCQCF